MLSPALCVGYATFADQFPVSPPILPSSKSAACIFTLTVNVCACVCACVCVCALEGLGVLAD